MGPFTEFLEIISHHVGAELFRPVNKAFGERMTSTHDIIPRYYTEKRNLIITTKLFYLAYWCNV